jgi:ABC-type uncharacterized transport system involved in gliding motility auxiliary subunit
MKVTARTRRMLQLQTAVFVVLFLLLIGLLGWLGTRYVYEADWTASGRNTLSEASVALLREFPGELRITAWARETPVLRNGITNIVARYQRHYPGIRLEFVNPDREPQLARELGIADGELILEYEGREERLREISESALSNAMQRLARAGDRRLLFLAGHGERNPNGRADHDYLGWAEQLRSKGIAVERINLVESPEIPPEAAALVIAAPQSDLLPGETALIADYVDRGGNLLWLVEPSAGLHGLEALAVSLGVRLERGIVVDPTVSAVGRMLFGIDDPRVALVASYPRHELTREFDRNTLFPIAGALTIDAPAGWEAVPVLETLSGAWLETGEVIGAVSFDEGEDIPGPLTLGVALSRATGDDPESPVQRVFIAADSDFLSNAFLGLAGNQQLGMNLANWLASDDRFLDIPVRSAPDSSLEFTPLTTAIIGFGFLLVLPSLLLGSGLLIWYRRRRR